MGDSGFNSGSGRAPGVRKPQIPPVFLPGGILADRGARRAIVHGVAVAQTRLKQLSVHSKQDSVSVKRMAYTVFSTQPTTHSYCMGPP